jgi:hypothetical protein
MISRCHNNKNPFYKDYGGRGIIVCEEWRHNVEKFINHIISLGWHKQCGLSIDRINNNEGYKPGNIRLATPVTQGRNNRRNFIIEYNGESAPISEWAERIGMPYPRLYTRLLRGWSVERAFSEPSRR